MLRSTVEELSTRMREGELMAWHTAARQTSLGTTLDHKDSEYVSSWKKLQQIKFTYLPFGLGLIIIFFISLFIQ